MMTLEQAKDRLAGCLTGRTTFAAVRIVLEGMEELEVQVLKDRQRLLEFGAQCAFLEKERSANLRKADVDGRIAVLEMRERAADSLTLRVEDELESAKVKIAALERKQMEDSVLPCDGKDRSRIAELEPEVMALKIKRRGARCSFCFKTLPPGALDKAGAIAHMKTCPEHPMRELEAEQKKLWAKIELLRSEAADLEEEISTCRIWQKDRENQISLLRAQVKRLKEPRTCEEGD